MSVFETNAPYFLVHCMNYRTPTIFCEFIYLTFCNMYKALQCNIDWLFNTRFNTSIFYSNNSTKSILSSLVKTSKVCQFHEIKTGKLKIAMKNNLTTSWKHPPYVIFKATVSYSPFQHSNLTSHMN